MPSDDGFMFRVPTEVGRTEREYGDKTAVQFGLFLVRQGRATPEQVIDALDRQTARQQPIGRVAYDESILTADQIIKVLGEQTHELEASRKRFGEIAVDHGYLNDTQVGQLLSAQRDGRPLLGDILVQMGVLDR
jgi:hypothetical protein